MHDELHSHGLSHDLRALFEQQRGRRGALRWLGAGAAALIGGCGGGGDSTTSTTSTSSSTAASTSSTTTTSAQSCSTIPSETQGPYPADASNGINALTMSGIVRSDIISSFNGASGVAGGTPLTVKLVIVNSGASCGTLAGFAVYAWHCDAQGRYSLYSSGVTGENYLRGVQVTDSSGGVTFKTIVPGCYSGRWPHIHFEVFSSLASATAGANSVKTSQLAMPEATCRTVYANSSLYPGSLSNLNSITMASDNVFGDGATLQLATVTGDSTSGYVATLRVGVAV